MTRGEHSRQSTSPPCFLAPHSSWLSPKWRPWTAAGFSRSSAMSGITKTRSDAPWTAFLPASDALHPPADGEVGEVFQGRAPGIAGGELGELGLGGHGVVAGQVQGGVVGAGRGDQARG